MFTDIEEILKKAELWKQWKTKRVNHNNVKETYIEAKRKI
jgi:hypothetical protein